MRHWTPEERQRQAELIRSWMPWRHSTGARTPEGKAVSSMNVLIGVERRKRAIEQATIELKAAKAKLDRLTAKRRA